MRFLKCLKFQRLKSVAFFVDLQSFREPQLALGENQILRLRHGLHVGR